MALRMQGGRLVDERGRQRVLHGINLVDKGVPGGGPGTARGFWSDDDLGGLRALGLDCVRLGVNWAAVEPVPGEYDQEHLAWILTELDRLHAHGFGVFLDAHQDLYSQVWANGAPGWATMHTSDFEATELWSDAYLSSPAVHEALDAFWADRPAPDGMGVQEHLVRMWGTVAERVAGHPALLGYDPWNEPTPGSASATVFGGLLQAFASATGQDFAPLLADFSDPEAKLAQLAHLDDPEVHRRIGDAVAPHLEAFEAAVGGLWSRITAAIRAVDAEGLILREHGYFSNLGIPAAIPVLDDDAWAYSPHGYDLVVDTEAMLLASNRRIQTIFERAHETAERLGVPVVVGEWGAFDFHEGITSHATHQLDLFDRYGWSWIYWAFQPGMLDAEVADVLARPRPVAVSGSEVRWGAEDGCWAASWLGGEHESEFWVPEDATVTCTVDGVPGEFDRQGSRVVVAAGEGPHRIEVR